MPTTYSSSTRWVSLLRLLMLRAAASVIAPPNPCISWYFLELSTMRITSFSDSFLTEKLLMDNCILLPSWVDVYHKNWFSCKFGSFIVSQYVELQTHTVRFSPNERCTHPSPIMEKIFNYYVPTFKLPHFNKSEMR